LTQEERFFFHKLIYRAVYDWLLYRESRELEKRKLAAEAYCWLFLGPEGSAPEGFYFYEVCEMLGVDPGVHRVHLRKLTLRQVGRLYRTQLTSKSR